MKANGYSSYDCRAKDYDTLKEFPYTYIVECFVCGVEELAVKAVFPEGWKKVKVHGYILCPECSNKLREKIVG